MNKFGAMTLVVTSVAMGFVSSELFRRPSKTSAQPPGEPTVLGGSAAPASPVAVSQVVRYVQPAATPTRAQTAPVESMHAVAEKLSPDDTDDALTETERQVYADSIFEDQAYDPTWAAASTRQLNAALSTINAPGLKLTGVECRSSLCKVELRASDKQTANASIRTVVHGMKWPGSGMAINGDPDARGELSVTLYLARRGSPLPEPPVAYR